MKLNKYKNITEIDDQIIKNVFLLLKNINNSVAHTKNITSIEKYYNDFVSNVDLQIQTFLKSRLLNICNVPCISEESDQNDKRYISYWIIDPIDGTTNYLHSYPSYCVSIALILEGEIHYGFVYNLVNKELFIAKLNQGSILTSTTNGNIKKISPSKINILKNAIIGFGCPYDKSKITKLFDVLKPLILECQDLKRNGPASLDICYVACGRLDGYLELDLKEWDYAAAKLILQEAGGMISNWYGETYLQGQNDILVTNFDLYLVLLNKVHKL